MEQIFTWLSELLYANFWFANFSAFIWGILSVLLSPCHLGSIPLIIGFLSSQKGITGKRTFALSLVFGLGILLTIGIIGGITLSLGGLMGDIGAIGNYVVAIVLITFGLYLMDIIKFDWSGWNLTKFKSNSMLAVFVLGLIFGIGLGPCTFAFMAPILGIVFQVSQTDLTLAISLILAFALGHSFVIVLAGGLSHKVQKYLNWTSSSKTTIYLKRACGILVIISGVYLIFLA